MISYKKAKVTKKKVTTTKEKKPTLLLPAHVGGPIVEDNLKRSVLSEGRNYGMGFGFCKKTGDNKYETVQPLSPCKDYLNDVIYTEHTGRDFSACGLITTKQNIFDGPSAYLAIKILPPKNGGIWPDTSLDFKGHQKRLSENYMNITTLLNYVEEQLNVEGRTTITKSSNDEDMFLLSVPYWWCRTTHLISLYSLLVRMGQFWNGEGTAKEFMYSYKQPLDLNIWSPSYGSGAKGKYECMVKYGVHVITPEELYDRNPSGPNIHSNGILNY